MQEYMRVADGFLVDRYEYARGSKASDKELKSREKALKSGVATLVETFHQLDKKKIYRKI